jgi:nucleoid DNA-binding protein
MAVSKVYLPKETYGKKEMILSLGKTLGINQKQAAVAVDELLLSMQKAVLDGKSLRLQGILISRVKSVETCTRRNPKTGEAFVAPGYSVATVKFMKSLAAASRESLSYGEADSAE